MIKVCGTLRIYLKMKVKKGTLNIILDDAYAYTLRHDRGCGTQRIYLKKKKVKKKP